MRVEHIPNSGWPGRPRNVGIGLARGEYVYFVDNDDYLGTEALERMHAMAVRDDADIVIGKVVGHGKSVPRNLFRRNRTGVDLQWEALVWLLTPHKLFRRSFLDAHDLRFPEGRRRLEDHVFVMRAYFLAPRISVLADYPCYHWVLRDRDTNASWGHLDPQSYFAFLREVLDIVDANTEPGAFRDRLYARWYRGKMLNRVEKVHANPDLAHRRALYEAMHELAVERFPAGVDAFLPFNLQQRSRLLRAGDYEGLAALADVETALRAQARAVAVRTSRGRRRAGAGGGAGAAALQARDSGGRVRWAGQDAADALAASTVQLLLKLRATQEEYRVPAETERLVADRRRRARRARRDRPRDRGDRGRRRAARGRGVGGARRRDRRRLPRRRTRAALPRCGAPDARGDPGRARRRAPAGMAAQPAPAHAAAARAGRPGRAARRPAPDRSTDPAATSAR